MLNNTAKIWMNFLKCLLSFILFLNEISGILLVAADKTVSDSVSEQVWEWEDPTPESPLVLTRIPLILIGALSDWSKSHLTEKEAEWSPGFFMHSPPLPRTHTWAGLWSWGKCMSHPQLLGAKEAPKGCDTLVPKILVGMGMGVWISGKGEMSLSTV